MIHPNSLNRDRGYAGQRMTAGEYLALGETLERYELIDGLVMMSRSPSTRHQLVCALLLAQILECRGKLKGLRAMHEIDLEIAPDLVLCPDIVAYAPSRLRQLPERLTTPPDLVVEVLSPGTGNRDLVRKRADYERFGVMEYWVIDPTPVTARVWRRENNALVEHATASAELECAAIPGIHVNFACIREELASE